MDLLAQYASDSESSSSASDGNERETVNADKDLNVGAVRQVYLVTYSQATVEQFPTRRSFAEAVVASFTRSNGRILHWVCCRETHKNGGAHYHMALKLDRCHRWLASKKYLKDHHGISVHFSSLHYNYCSAWKYVTKEDKHSLQNDKHPKLWNSKEPKTSRACSERKKIRCEQEAAVTSGESIESGDDLDSSDGEAAIAETEDSCKRSKRKKRLTPFELSEIIVEKGIKSRTELLGGPRTVSEILHSMGIENFTRQTGLIEKDSY